MGRSRSKCIAIVVALLGVTPMPLLAQSSASKDTYDAAIQRHLETARALARASASQPDEPSIDWIASGGVRDRADVETLAQTGVAGCVAGTALLEGTLTLEELAACSRAA